MREFRYYNLYLECSGIKKISRPDTFFISTREPGQTQYISLAQTECMHSQVAVIGCFGDGEPG